jgi:hypothetical protein
MTQRKQWSWITGIGLSAALALAGCGSDTSKDTGATSAALTGSSFESNDGNLVVDGGTGAHDWANAPNFKFAVDKASGSGDDSFGQGSKEDIPNPTLVTGSIPNNKSDLTRFYVGNEIVSGNFFLYLAWERANILGSANMDFEFNQSKVLDGNGVTPVRTAGDMLVTFDFTNGGTNPVLGLLRWVTSGPTSQCEASNALPCWGNRITLGGNVADGAVFPLVGCSVDADCPASATCTGPQNGNLKKTCETRDTTLSPTNNNLPVDGLEFGEAAINLTAAGVFVPGQCVNFASAYLKSRSSASFTAELKDFIAPLNVNINNCANVNIHKQDDAAPPNPLAGATFQLFNAVATDPTGTTCGGTAVTGKSCTTDTSGNCSIFDVFNGTYCIAETTTPAGYDTAPTQVVTITAGVPSSTLFTFTDPRQPGAILVTKTAKRAGVSPDPALAGVTFELWNAAGTTQIGTSKTTDANGQVCFDGLKPLGTTYTVKETAAPTGYNIDTASKTVTVTKTASCTATTDAAKLSFTNTPKSRITVSFKSLADTPTVTDVTKATILCTGDTPPNYVALPQDTPKVLDNLVPGTYTCSVIVDP